MDKEIIKKIIEAGNHAPSGGNSQPWKFIVKNNVIQIIALPENDHRILNFKNRGTYIAHGALIENIDITSRALGYEPKFELFPKTNVSTSVTFYPLNGTREVDLYSYIFQRHSNRKSFKTEPLSQKEKEYIFQDVNKFPQCELSVVEGEDIHRVAENVAFDTVINLQNQLLHKLLFQEIIWKEEEQKYRSGLYVKTMEVTPPKAFVFGLLKHWKIAQLFNKLKIPQKIHTESTKTMSSSGLFGAIVVSNDDKSFIHAGRLMENIWLRTAKLGLGFHLITGVVFYWQQINLGDNKIFSVEERNIINRAYENLSEIFKVKNRIIALTFRIGKADKPSAVSYRRPSKIEWNDE